MTDYRVSFTTDQFQAVLEAAHNVIDSDAFIAKQLLSLALSMKYSVDQGLEWRAGDEA